MQKIQEKCKIQKTNEKNYKRKGIFIKTSQIMLKQQIIFYLLFLCADKFEKHYICIDKNITLQQYRYDVIF